jgi:hypothetical protein
LIEEASNYGTGLWAGARKGYCRLVSDNMEVNENTFESPALGSRAVSAMYQGAREVGGTMEVETSYDGVWMYFLKHAFGSYGFTAANPSGVSNRHRFTPAEDLPNSLCMELCMAGIPSADKVIRYPGVKVNSLELSLEQGGILKCMLDLICYDEDINNGNGHTPVDGVYPVFTTLRPIKFWHQVGTDSVITVAGTTLASTTGFVRNWRFKIDNKLERRFNLARRTAEPFQGEKREVTFDCTAEFDSTVGMPVYRKYLDATEGTFKVRMSSKDEAVWIPAVGTLPYAMELNGTTQRLTGSRPKITDAGIVTVDFTSRLIGSTELTLDLFNGQATL